MGISLIETTIPTTLPKRPPIMKPSVQNAAKINDPSIDMEANVIVVV